MGIETATPDVEEPTDPSSCPCRKKSPKGFSGDVDITTDTGAREDLKSYPTQGSLPQISQDTLGDHRENYKELSRNAHTISLELLTSILRVDIQYVYQAPH